MYIYFIYTDSFNPCRHALKYYLHFTDNKKHREIKELVPDDVIRSFLITALKTTTNNTQLLAHGFCRNPGTGWLGSLPKVSQVWNQDTGHSVLFCELKVSFQAYSGCWQNLVPVGVGLTKFLASCQPMSLSAPTGHPQGLATWLVSRAVPSTAVCSSAG